MLIIPSDASHCLCCLELLSPPQDFSFSPLPTQSGFCPLHSSRKALVRVARNLHVTKSDSLLGPPLTPTSVGTYYSLPQPLDHTLCWFSFYLKDQSFLVILSGFSFCAGPLRLERPWLSQDPVLLQLYFFPRSSHLIHPNVDVSYIYDFRFDFCLYCIASCPFDNCTWMFNRHPKCNVLKIELLNPTSYCHPKSSSPPPVFSIWVNDTTLCLGEKDLGSLDSFLSSPTTSFHQQVLSPFPQDMC